MCPGLQTVTQASQSLLSSPSGLSKLFTYETFPPLVGLIQAGLEHLGSNHLPCLGLLE